MEGDGTMRKRLRSRVPLFTVFACVLVAVAFAHINVLGVYRSYPHFPGEGNPAFYSMVEDHFQHGWPIPYATHKLVGDVEPKDTSLQPAFSIESLKGLICDAFLSLTFIAVTGVAVLRLERRRWGRLQFSIADMFSLIATTSMVLGLACLDGRLCVGDESAAEGIYVRLCDLPLFDRLAVLFAVACAVWLVISTALARLGNRIKSQG